MAFSSGTKTGNREYSLSRRSLNGKPMSSYAARANRGSAEMNGICGQISTHLSVEEHQVKCEDANGHAHFRQLDIFTCSI